MQTSSNNFHKICTGTKHVNKANKSGFAILSFFRKYLCNKQHFRPSTKSKQNANQHARFMQASCTTGKNISQGA